MLGFTIHIAIAKKYIEKHENEIKNEEEFIKGVIAPDMNENLDGPAVDKSKNHYGKWRKYEVTTYIDEFLKDSIIDMKKDFWKGYFLHLLTDHYFYKMYFKKEHEEIVKNNDRFYYDYDCLNKSLIERYQIHVLDNIKKYMNMFDDKPKYLTESKVIDFIEEISSMDIQDKTEIISQKGMSSL
ncbi:MAG: hypothetical protein IJE68_02785 [Clostridia bacterium]|nr:hypothetical protein [Clostridia bacterium]